MARTQNTRTGEHSFNKYLTMSQAVELLAKYLNPQCGVFCPSPKADMKVWNTHPKVYLDVAREGHAQCPYCGTVYQLKAGEAVGHGH